MSRRGSIAGPVGPDESGTGAVEKGGIDTEVSPDLVRIMARKHTGKAGDLPGQSAREMFGRGHDDVLASLKMGKD